MSNTKKRYKTGLLKTNKTNKTNKTKKSNSSKHKKSLAFQSYKFVEENMKNINKQQYYDLKRCSQKNCRKIFDDTIKENDKLIKKHSKERINQTKKNMEFVLKKYNLPKNHKISFEEPAYKELIKLNSKSMKKRLKKRIKERKKLNKRLHDCQKTHCKKHKNKLDKTIKKHKEVLLNKLNKLNKSLKTKKIRK